MAKTAHCAFCGKELTTGFFKGTETFLLFETHSISCCDDCYALYDNKAVNKRFEAKLRNLKYKRHVKLTNEEVFQMYKTYLKEQTEHALDLPGQATMQKAFYCYAGKYFSVRECAMDELSLSSAGMIKHVAKNVTATGSGLFSAEDITCIEFRRDSFGTAAGLFKRGYNYFIRLNDHKVISYRPAITRTVTIGWGPFFHRSADKAMRKQLEEFCKQIGCNLPIVKVKKFT